MNIDGRLFRIAYKKLKSSLYYDKTQIILRNNLVQYEAQIGNIEQHLNELAEQFSDAKKEVNW